MRLIPKCKPHMFQRREYSRDGVTDHGLCTEDRVCQEYYRRHPLLPLQQAEQDAEEGLHRMQAPGVHAGESR